MVCAALAAEGAAGVEPVVAGPRTAPVVGSSPDRPGRGPAVVRFAAAECTASGGPAVWWVPQKAGVHCCGLGVPGVGLRAGFRRIAQSDAAPDGQSGQG